MLVISRRKEESVMIGDDIEVIILDVRGSAVRIGIQAPKSVPVFRKEIYEKRAQQNEGGETQH